MNKMILDRINFLLSGLLSGIRCMGFLPFPCLRTEPDSISRVVVMIELGSGSAKWSEYHMLHKFFKIVYRMIVLLIFR